MVFWRNRREDVEPTPRHQIPPALRRPPDGNHEVDAEGHADGEVRIVEHQLDLRIMPKHVLHHDPHERHHAQRQHEEVIDRRDMKVMLLRHVEPYDTFRAERCLKPG